jgi:hypothetical protein
LEQLPIAISFSFLIKEKGIQFPYYPDLGFWLWIKKQRSPMDPEERESGREEREKSIHPFSIGGLKSE